MRRVSVDIGGTFTVCFAAGAMTSSIESKTLTPLAAFSTHSSGIGS